VPARAHYAREPAGQANPAIHWPDPASVVRLGIGCQNLQFLGISMRFRYTFAAVAYVAVTVASTLTATKSIVAAPRVRLDTVFGNIDIELLHEEAPLTVTNFLNYIVSDRFDEMFFHRSVPDFVVQGGGFIFPEGGSGFDFIETDDPVMNEPGVSNTRGTVAMAKPPGQPNGATSQFFFNLVNNTGLDTAEGGFTVFGRVIGNGMTVVDQIAALQRVPAGGPGNVFATLPVRNFDGVNITRDNLVIVNDVQVLATGVPGDYNASGLVEQADLDLVLSNWGKSAMELPNGWFQDLPSGNVDQNELDGVLANWGKAAAGSSSLTAGSVPEPSSWLLALVAVAVLVRHAARRGAERAGGCF
jgi:peptidyl-prolyl cis-trans isomerase A (cyclophilin A)